MLEGRRNNSAHPWAADLFWSSPFTDDEIERSIPVRSHLATHPTGHLGVFDFMGHRFVLIFDFCYAASLRAFLFMSQLTASQVSDQRLPVRLSIACNRAPAPCRVRGALTPVRLEAR